MELKCIQLQSQFALFVKYFIGKAIRCLQTDIHIIHVWSDANRRRGLYINVTVRRNKFLFNNQPDVSIIQIYSAIKLYMFRVSSLPIIRSSLLHIRHW